jgi:hypothetical protein
MGNLTACTNLGLMRRHGLGVPKNEAAAIELLRKVRLRRSAGALSQFLCLRVHTVLCARAPKLAKAIVASHRPRPALFTWRRTPTHIPCTHAQACDGGLSGPICDEIRASAAAPQKVEKQNSK